MSFLTDKPDLSGTIYTEQDLSIAREYLLSALRKINPQWLDCPIGNLALYWNSGGQYPACFLIWIAQIIYTLDRGNVTEKSASIFHSKFEELTKASSPQYDEILTELEVAAHLVGRMSPISFEPFVPKSLQGDKPKSPDYAFRLPDGDVAIEVTVFYFDMLEKWDASCRIIVDEITKWLQKNMLSRSLQILIPLDAQPSDIKLKELTPLIDQVKLLEESETQFSINGKSIEAKWTTPHQNEGISSFVQVHYTPILTEEVNDKFYKSVRNTLERKRDQLIKRAELPYFLVIKLGQYQLAQKSFDMLINNRIWKNEQYKKISGIISFQSRKSFGQNDPASSAFLNINPKATHQAPASLIKVFEGEAEYHL